MNDSAYIQSETVRMNKQLSNSFFRTGLIILGIVLLAFGFKSYFGYYKVEKIDTLDGCHVETKMEREEYRDPDGGTDVVYIYYVAVAYEAKPSEISSDFYTKFGIDKSKSETGENGKCRFVLFNRTVDKDYYERFTHYTAERVTFFKTDDGGIYPVYKYDSTNKEAEHAIRECDPPIVWYWCYKIGIGLSVISIILGIASRSTAKNYQRNNLKATSVNYNNNPWNK